MSKMKIDSIHSKKEILDNQYKNIQWLDGSGLDKEQLKQCVLAMTEEMKDL